jgi:hypothetical protein
MKDKFDDLKEYDSDQWITHVSWWWQIGVV